LTPPHTHTHTRTHEHTHKCTHAHTQTQTHTPDDTPTLKVILFRLHLISLILPESFMRSSEATLTLMSWLSRLLLLGSMGLPSSRGFRPPSGPSWQKLKLGARGLWEGSAPGSSFTRIMPLRLSF